MCRGDAYRGCILTSERFKYPANRSDKEDAIARPSRAVRPVVRLDDRHVPQLQHVHESHRTAGSRELKNVLGLGHCESRSWVPASSRHPSQRRSPVHHHPPAHRPKGDRAGLTPYGMCANSYARLPVGSVSARSVTTPSLPNEVLLEAIARDTAVRSTPAGGFSPKAQRQVPDYPCEPWHIGSSLLSKREMSGWEFRCEQQVAMRQDPGGRYRWL